MASAGEEAAVIAQEFVTSLDNVPAEVQFLLAEMRERESKILELQNRLGPRAAQYIRHASKNSLNEKDAQMFDKIQTDFERISALSDEKVELAKKLKRLLTKHANRLQVELGRITHPGEYTRSAIPYATPTVPISTHHLPALPTIAATPMTLNPVVRTPMTGVLATMQSDSISTAASVNAAPPAVAPVPTVLEPTGTSVSAAPSPASAPATKRRRLNSTAPAAPSAPGTPAATRPAAPRTSGNTTAVASNLAPITPSVPGTPSTSRPRRAASATVVNTSPSAPTTAAAGGQKNATERNMSESTVSSATTGTEAGGNGDDKDEEMADPGSASTGEGEGDNDDGPYCVCQEKSYGEMIGCDNGADCPYQWFHVACVHVQKPLPNTWYCDHCTKKLGFADNTGASLTTSATNKEDGRGARRRRK
ncbi:hypothetical protein M408DRAFT_17196 [Serendipita vermifera MAFF 305830]|uniref:Chromatin modification-related protein n=1 Tax=Serendipita vermifera MAFF 305830 TaxID=933852 RepID=A0A0C2X8X7_SERVB|nr:hypothetical protein M408DRAFT_17196 [Serendipita vermifera MAFF 305830]